MGKTILLLLSILGLFTSLSCADWNILNRRAKNGMLNFKYSLKNYCEAWRMNVELNNVRGFESVPDECTGYIGKYMKSTQYEVDVELAVESCIIYLSKSCSLENDGKDAWVFDVDDTLLSTLPYFKKHNYGGEKLNLTSLEEWMGQGKAPAIEHTLKLFNDIKSRGIQVILVSSRREHLRSATIDNLVDVGFHGWASLILRGLQDELKEVQSFKAKIREQLVGEGYRIWGVIGDQWSSLHGNPSAERTFKLPNPLYHIS